MFSDPVEALGAYLTVREATGIAELLASGEHTTRALNEVSFARREEAQLLFRAGSIGHTDRDRSVAVLRAIAGAKSVVRNLTPVWTMPGNEAEIGRLTGEFHRLVQAARQSVTCATYNFSNRSKMWTVLQEASEQPGVVVTVYIDGEKADGDQVKAQLPRATVYRSAVLPDGHRMVSHAKFVVIDHEMLLLTSANFSYNAENRNVEFGVLAQDSGLASSIESTMTSKHGSLYELVPS